VNDYDRAGLLMHVLASRSVLGGFAVSAALSWVYLARNHDWRDCMFAVPAAVAVVAILVPRPADSVLGAAALNQRAAIR
jgi:hypothetical protein